MTTLNRRHFFGLTAASATGLLVGCTPETTPMAPEAGPQLVSPTPVLSEDKFSTILSEFTKALIEADKAKKVDALAPRVSGSAAEFRQATYKIIAKVPEHASALQVPSDQLVVPVATTADSFPRYAIAMVKDTNESGLPFFVALEQADARSQFTSWGWARQAAGIEMPTVPNIEVGASQVARDESGLVLEPMKALKKYADLLSWGHEQADPDDLILQDPFQKSVHAEIQGERSQINHGVQTNEVATVHEDYAVKEEEFIGLRTAEGGAMVMATLTSKRTIKVHSGSISYNEDNLYTTLAGTKEFKKEVVRTYGSTVILHIPAADSGEKIQPIGAFKVLLTVSGS